MDKIFEMVKDPIYRFDDFDDNKVLHNKKKNHLPAMGWNSWNAFGSGNTEALTKKMAECIIELGLDKLGYKYVVLDDGCYKPKRIDDKLSNDDVKFPSGFRALADYLHEKGLKFGMYNDIGTNLCAGAQVGTCGYEDIDAKTYLDWAVDFLKVDNCYYLWDNATFANPENAKYVYAPNIKSVKVSSENLPNPIVIQAKDMILTGKRAQLKGQFITQIGTFDGTGPERTPVGLQSSEARFIINAPEDGDYSLRITYATGAEEGVGAWLQIAVGEGNTSRLIFDEMLPLSGSPTMFADSKAISIPLKKGDNLIRLMNHRRQENTLGSYGTLVKELNNLCPGNDIILSICEWGKTQPQNWGYKVGDSWRILNDITFRVGADGDPGYGSWTGDYTTSIVTQYSKAVIMDEFAGLSKGWNDPDMMMIGMNGLNDTMNKTHMTMWCMMNSPLMLGLDLRRISKGDSLYKIIANKELIAVNQDSLGVQAKRIYCSKLTLDEVDKTYILDPDRIDILAKPLSDGSVVISVINLDDNNHKEKIAIDTKLIVNKIGEKLPNSSAFANANSFEMTDIWTNEISIVDKNSIIIEGIPAYDNITFKLTVK